MAMAIHFHVLGILFIASLLIFFSSFVSLDHQSGHEQLAPQHVVANAATGGIDRAKILELSRTQTLSNELPGGEKDRHGEHGRDNLREDKKQKKGGSRGDKKKEKRDNKKKEDKALIKPAPKDKEQGKQKEVTEKTEKNKSKKMEKVVKNVLDPNTGDTPAAIRISTSKAKHFTEEEKKQKCTTSFPAKCQISRWVHYWNDNPECYVSPLRKANGLAASNEDRKFIVFQPDLGGWNNIRMALEVVILLAKVTGRILVMPPSAILYLLNLKKKWGENKSGMEDYFDFNRLSGAHGLETMPMRDFLETVARPGLLELPLPDDNIDLIKKPLWDYLEKACFLRQWSPGMLYVGLNIPPDIPSCDNVGERTANHCIGDFNHTQEWRIQEFNLVKRHLLPYDEDMNSHRTIYFPGHEQNRLLTHFYSFLFFATEAQDHAAKRFIRDRLRYHDEIFCVGSKIVETMVGKQLLAQTGKSTVEEALIAAGVTNIRDVEPQYIAFHIRRGDFQQKHTRLPAEQIVELTNHLVPDRHERVAYIATDEGNRTFFAPFFAEYKAVYFLDEVKNNSGIETVSANYVGMIEQVVCAAAHTFIGTPLSTFTAYITRMRGYMNRTIEITDGEPKDQPFHLDRRGIYNRTYYFMKHHMYQLHTKPKVHFPLWIRDFVDVFQDIDDDLDYREFGEL